ncbi:MAG: hypothetical protein JNL28_01050 [Planctomycetes bacterium]|nr:hypothetical protein [Planctomycetota bacterium]
MNRTEWIALPLVLLLAAGDATALGGGDTCAGATPLAAGTHTGFGTWVVWPGGTNPNAIVHDEDWFWIRAAPGEQLDVTARITGSSGSSAYYTLMRLYESSPATCSGALLATSFSDHVATVNTTIAPKDYVVYYSMGVNSAGQSAALTFDLQVQLTSVQTGVSYCPGALNSLGLAGQLNLQGSHSVGANDLVFLGRDLPPNSFALLASGTVPNQAPFGDGVLCIGGAFQRLHFLPVTPVGTWSAALDIPNLHAAITAGDLRYFQLYYRDVGGPQGSGFNLTNGQAIAFTP